MLFIDRMRPLVLTHFYSFSNSLEICFYADENSDEKGDEDEDDEVKEEEEEEDESSEEG